MIVIPHPFSNPETLPVSTFWVIFVYLTTILLALITSYKDRVKFFEKGSPALQITASTTLSLILLYIFPISTFVVLAFDGYLSIYFPIFVLSIIFFVGVLAALFVAILHNMEREHELRWLHNTKSLQKAYQDIVLQERTITKKLAKQLNALSITDQHKLSYDAILPIQIEKELTRRMMSIRELHLEKTLPKIAHLLGKLIVAIPARQQLILNTAQGRGLLRVVSDKAQEFKREIVGNLTQKEKVVEDTIFRIVVATQKANLSDYEKAQISAITLTLRNQESKITQDIIDVLEKISDDCLQMSKDPKIAGEDIDKLLQSVKIDMMDVRAQIQALGDGIENLERKRYEINKKRGNILVRAYQDIKDLIHRP